MGTASSFVELIADAFARAEVTACVEGDASAFAAAFSFCSARAYAVVWTAVRSTPMFPRPYRAWTTCCLAHM